MHIATSLNPKSVGMNLTKDMQYFYEEIYKTLLEEILKRSKEIEC